MAVGPPHETGRDQLTREENIVFSRMTKVVLQYMLEKYPDPQKHLVFCGEASLDATWPLNKPGVPSIRMIHNHFMVFKNGMLKTASLAADDDPEEAWEVLAPCFLRELKEYGAWKVEGVRRPSEQAVHTVADLRRQKRFEVLRPEEARERLRAQPCAGSRLATATSGALPTCPDLLTCRRCTRAPPCASASCCTRSIKEATMEYSCTRLLALKIGLAFVEKGREAFGEVRAVRNPCELGELGVEVNVESIHAGRLVEEVLGNAERGRRRLRELSGDLHRLGIK